MSIQHLTIALCLAGFFFAAGTELAHGQVLTLPAPAESNTVKTQFSGIVSQQKKYSFTVKSGDRDYEVKLAPGTKLILRLNKPTFDFTDRTVRVLRVVTGSNEQVENESAEPERMSYQLPEALFVTAKFEHVHQMQRIMQAKVKRINNYVLMPKDPGAEMPTESTLQIRGRLLPTEQADIAQLKVNDEEFAVMMGQRGATMSGFNILDLPVESTEVFVWGITEDDGVVSAERVEFQPIVVKN